MWSNKNTTISNKLTILSLHLHNTKTLISTSLQCFASIGYSLLLLHCDYSFPLLMLLLETPCKSNPFLFLISSYFTCVIHDILFLFIIYSFFLYLIFMCFVHDDYAFNFANNPFIFLLLWIYFACFAHEDDISNLTK